MKNCYFFITDKSFLDYTQIAVSSLVKTNPKADILVYAVGCSPEIPGAKVFPAVPEHLPFEVRTIAPERLDLLGLRIKILDDLKTKYSKILMLDTDILVLGNLEDLFSLSGDFIYGRDEYRNHLAFRKRFLGDLWFKPKFYLNSGVLLLPSKVLKTLNLFEAFKSELSSRAGEYLCPEQDFLNFVFKDKTFDLGKEYNLFVTTKDFSKPKVIHYMGTAKPLKASPFQISQTPWFYRVFAETVESCKDLVSEEFYTAVKDKIWKAI